MIDDLFSPERPLTLVRLGQVNFGEGWVSVPTLDDYDLAHGTPRYQLAAQGRVLASMDHVARLHAIASTHEDAVRNKDEVLSLVAGAPFVRWPGVMELDVCDESEEFKRIGKDAARSRSVAMARALAARAPERGLGRPAWFATNDRGGIHGDLLTPWSVVSVHLVVATGALVRRLANELGIPLLSDLPKELAARPAVYVDDTILTRYAERRGGLWRVVRGTKKAGGFPKTPLDLQACRLLDPGVRNEPQDFVDRDALIWKIGEFEEQARVHAANVRRGEKRGVTADLTIEVRASYDPPTEHDLALMRGAPKALRKWNAVDSDESVRVRAFLRGLYEATELWWDDEATARLLWAMPGNKALRDGRPEYVIENVQSAKRKMLEEGFTPAGVPLDVPDDPTPDDPPAYVPREGLAGPALREWLASVHAPGWTRPEGLRDDRPPPETILRSAVGALLGAGLSPDLVTDVVAQVEPTIAARERVRATVQRLGEGKPTAGATSLRRHLGSLALARLARAIARDVPAAPNDRPEEGRVLRIALGRGLLHREDASWLDRVASNLPETHVARRALRRPGACCLLHEEQRSNFDGRVIAAKRLTCEAILCGSCWSRRIRADAKLALDGWGEGEERVPGWLDRSKLATYAVHRVDGIADWAALKRLTDGYARYTGAKFRAIGVDPETGRLAAVLVSEGHDVGYANSAASLCMDWSKDSGQTLTRQRDLTAEQAMAVVVELRASWHAWLRRLVEERRGRELAEWLVAMRGKHLVSRSRAALPWPPREVSRRAFAPPRDVAETHELDDQAGFHYDLKHSLTDTLLHRQDRPHAYDEAVRHLAIKGDQVGAELQAMHEARDWVDQDDPGPPDDWRWAPRDLRALIARPPT